jgi:D-alanyl-D-alanine dipeptidase
MPKEGFKKLHKIQIYESNEPLLDIKKHCPKIFIKVWGIRKKEKTFYARKSVIQKLKKVQRFLPHGYFLRVMDAFRPLAIQEHYYQKLYFKLKNRYPAWNERKIKRLQNTLVYPPKLETPPHSTGGALDVTLIKDLKTGKSIKMNNRKVSKYEQNKTFSQKIPYYIRKNREILYSVMHKAGFSNYSEEWWHWSYGDRSWAMKKNKKYAIYGTVPDKFLPEVFRR